MPGELYVSQATCWAASLFIATKLDSPPSLLSPHIRTVCLNSLLRRVAPMAATQTDQAAPRRPAAAAIRASQKSTAGASRSARQTTTASPTAFVRPACPKTHICLSGSTGKRACKPIPKPPKPPCPTCPPPSPEMCKPVSGWQPRQQPGLRVCVGIVPYAWMHALSVAHHWPHTHQRC